MDHGDCTTTTSAQQETTESPGLVAKRAKPAREQGQYAQRRLPTTNNGAMQEPANVLNVEHIALAYARACARVAGAAKWVAESFELQTPDHRIVDI